MVKYPFQMVILLFPIPPTFPEEKSEGRREKKKKTLQKKKKKLRKATLLLLKITFSLTFDSLSWSERKITPSNILL